MKKRQLLVFAGQSNMMGACVHAPGQAICVHDSFEYLYKAVYLGAKAGAFRPAGFPCGEFLYADPAEAYPEGPDKPSQLDNYRKNACFVPSMCNLLSQEERTTLPFDVFSESHFVPGPTLPPYLAQEWEALGHACAYAHIAKGAVSIVHYFSDAMFAQSHAQLPSLARLTPTAMTRRAAACFDGKVSAFFRESQRQFPDEDLSDKCLIWLQGESDHTLSAQEYQTLLAVFWAHAKELGFTHFLCLRVGFFGSDGVAQVMKAQEDFCRTTPDAFLLTRACSMMPFAGQPENWFTRDPGPEYALCRDSFEGFANQHINEKGFQLLARRSAQNMHRVLANGQPPVLEDEILTALL